MATMCNCWKEKPVGIWSSKFPHASGGHADIPCHCPPADFSWGMRSSTDWTPHGGLCAHFVLAASSLVPSIQALRSGRLESSSINITSAQANVSPSFPRPWCTTKSTLVETASFHGSWQQEWAHNRFDAGQYAALLLGTTLVAIWLLCLLG